MKWWFRKNVLAKLPFGYWSGYGSASGHRGKQGPAGISLDEAARNALSVCVQGANPPLSSEEFERLYCLILDNEVRKGGYDAGELIQKYLDGRKI